MDYLELVKHYEELNSTSKRLEKTAILADLLKKVNKEDLDHLTFLIQGSVFSKNENKELGVSNSLIIKAINKSTGSTDEKIKNLWREKGDLGEVAEFLVKNTKQRTLASSKLTINKVINNIRKIPELEGQGSVSRKVNLISELLTSAKPLEAKYIVKTILGNLRIGVAEGTFRDAIVWTYFSKEVELDYDKKENKIKVNREEYKKHLEVVQEAIDLTNDFSQVVVNAKKGLKELMKVELRVGKPINVMLYHKAEDIKDAFKIVGKPAAFEYKYDGFRLQIHKDKEIKLYTRRLEDVSKQFPEIVKAVKDYCKGKNFILDVEAVGYNPKTGKYLPFQGISQRIKRKYNIEEMSKKFPVEVNIFDLLYYNGENFFKKPFKERREKLKKVLPREKKKKIVLAKQIITKDVKEAEEFLKESLDKGEEGVMVKNLEAFYKPGRRVGYGVKIKEEPREFDLVIVKGEWGQGKRSNWITSYTVACRDKDEFLEVGKASTGLKEKEPGLTFNEMTKRLKPLIIKQEGRDVVVKPKIVIEVGYDEIQKSPTYSSGYALRFPRVKNLREDKALREINTLSEVKKSYNNQKK